jgi:hypothetical protein
MGTLIVARIYTLSVDAWLKEAPAMTITRTGAFRSICGRDTRGVNSHGNSALHCGHHWDRRVHESRLSGQGHSFRVLAVDSVGGWEGWQLFAGRFLMQSSSLHCLDPGASTISSRGSTTEP